MRFWKMNGAGNDFIILDGIREKIDPAEISRMAAVLCERHCSIGADGLMLVLPAVNKKADFRMMFYNSDGSLGEMCGNGARCICRYGFETGLSGELQNVETTAGLVTGERIDRRYFRIRLNDPTPVDPDIPVTVGKEEYRVSYVELGDPGIPHGVLELPEKFVPAVHRLLHKEAGSREEDDGQKRQAESDRLLLGELREIGRKLRNHPKFPKGANINFYALTGKDALDIITFERGVEDFTYACGTGTGSTVHVLKQKGLVGSPSVNCRNRGGLLIIDDTEEGLFLTGPTNIVAVGEVRDEDCPL